MVDQGAQLLVGDLAGVGLFIEVDVLEDALKGRIDVFEGTQRLVQPVPDIAVKILVDPGPACCWGNKERAVVIARLQDLDQVVVRRAVRAARLFQRARSAMKTSELRFKKSMPKIYSLNSDASILPRRISAAAKRWRSS